MSVSIAQRKKNAGEALFDLAGDISEHATLSDTTLNELFANTALGGLGQIPPVANQVVACFMKTENYSTDEYFV